MVIHYLRLAWRSLLKKKGYAITTLTGLSVGLATCLLILLFVIDELSFDQYHVNKDRIFRLATAIKGASFEGVAKVNGPWGLAASEEIPEIESVSRFVMTGQLLMEYNRQKFYEPNGFYADSSVFRIFSFELLEGDPASALAGLNNIVLSESLSKKYFGQTSPLGQTLRIDGDTDYKVTGVVKDISANSHFTFDYLLSMSSLQHPQRDSWSGWNQFYTYLLLKPQADPKAVADKMKSIINKNVDAETAGNFTPFLQPLTRIHLHSHLHRELRANSDITYLYIFSTIATLILAISCANFVNITTAQASGRSKEIGVRKVNGAVRSQLVIQFMTEVLLICIVSMFIAQLISVVTLPVLNELTSKNIQRDQLTKPVILLFTGGVTLLSAMLAGSYPALYQSSMKPMQVLKGRWTLSATSGLRKTLVVFQFVLSSILMMATVVIFQQLKFIQDKPLGFDPEQIITIPIQSNSLRADYHTIKTELLKHPGVSSVSLSGNTPGGSDWGMPTLPEGFSADNVPPIRVMAVDHDFTQTYGIRIREGRAFRNDIASDSGAYLINEEAARQLGWKDPTTKTFSIPAADRGTGPVVGIIEDFHFRSVREKIAPLLLFIPPAEWYSTYSIKIDAGNTKQTLEYIEQQWARFDPEHPFTYNFFDQGYSMLYQQERRLASIVGYFTAIGIFLATLGLYSLASYTTQQRVREIGIRKVIGASTNQLIGLLTRQYLVLVIVGFAIAIPIAWYALEQWLQSFAYHISFNILLVMLCGSVSISVALLAVGYRALKAANANPVEALRSE